MLWANSRYPAPALRLYLMARCAERLGLAPPPDDLCELLDAALAEASLPPAIAEDLAIVPLALDFALGPMPGALAALLELTGFAASDFAPGGACATWATRLAEPGPLPPVHADLRSPRLLAAAAATAWWSVRDEANDGRRAARRDALRANVLEALPRSGPPGVRAPLLPAGARPGEGAALATAWLAASRALRQDEGFADEPEHRR